LLDHYGSPWMDFWYLYVNIFKIGFLFTIKYHEFRQHNNKLGKDIPCQFAKRRVS